MNALTLSLFPPVLAQAAVPTWAWTALVVVGLIVVLITGISVWASRYTKVGPNEVLIISGRRYRVTDPGGQVLDRGFRVVKGGGTFVLPVVEKVDILGIFSTPATTNSRVFEIEIDKRRQDVAVFVEPCPELARMIETGAGAVDLAQAVESHVQSVSRRVGRPPDRAILGCTHYEMVADMFRAALRPGTPLIHQPAATADALSAYLAKHPEYRQGDGGARRFLTTGRPGAQNSLVETFWGGPLSFEQI